MDPRTTHAPSTTGARPGGRVGEQQARELGAPEQQVVLAARAATPRERRHLQAVLRAKGVVQRAVRAMCALGALDFVLLAVLGYSHRPSVFLVVISLVCVVALGFTWFVTGPSTLRGFEPEAMTSIVTVEGSYREMIVATSRSARIEVSIGAWSVHLPRAWRGVIPQGKAVRAEGFLVGGQLILVSLSDRWSIEREGRDVAPGEHRALMLFLLSIVAVFLPGALVTAFAGDRIMDWVVTLRDPLYLWVALLVAAAATLLAAILALALPRRR